MKMMKIVFTLTLLGLYNVDETFGLNNDTTFNDSVSLLSSGEFKSLSPEQAYNVYRVQHTAKDAALRDSLICKFICACVRIREHNTQEFALFKHLPLFQGKRNDEKWALYVESGIHIASGRLQAALNNNKSGEYLRFGRSMIRSREIANAHAREDNRTVTVLKQYREGSADSIFEMLRHESNEWLFTRDDIEDMNLLMTAREMEKLLWIPLMTVNDTEFVVPLESSMKCYISPENVHSWVQANRKKHKMDSKVERKEDHGGDNKKGAETDKKGRSKVDEKEGSKVDKKEKSRVDQKEERNVDKNKGARANKKEEGKIHRKEGREIYRKKGGNKRSE